MFLFYSAVGPGAALHGRVWSKDYEPFESFCTFWLGGHSGTRVTSAVGHFASLDIITASELKAEVGSSLSSSFDGVVSTFSAYMLAFLAGGDATLLWATELVCGCLLNAGRRALYTRAISRRELCRAGMAPGQGRGRRFITRSPAGERVLGRRGGERGICRLFQTRADSHRVPGGRITSAGRTPPFRRLTCDLPTAGQRPTLSGDRVGSQYRGSNAPVFAKATRLGDVLLQTSTKRSPLPLRFLSPDGVNQW